MIKKKAILRIINVAEQNNKSVSQLLGIQCDYCSFCLDEACTYIYNRYSQMEEKERRRIKWIDKKKVTKKNNNDVFKALKANSGR